MSLSQIAMISAAAAFKSTVNQACQAVNTTKIIDLDGTYFANWFDLVGGRIVSRVNGVVRLTAMLQITNTSGTNNFFLSFGKNGAVSTFFSDIQQSITGNGKTSSVPYGYTLECVEGDTIELHWSVSSLNVSLVAQAGSPSAIINVALL